MKLKVIHCMAGSGFVHHPGDVVEFDDAEGVRLVEAGIAEPLGPETASVEPAENASLPRSRKRVAKNRDGADG